MRGSSMPYTASLSLGVSSLNVVDFRKMRSGSAESADAGPTTERAPRSAAPAQIRFFSICRSPAREFQRRARRPAALRGQGRRGFLRCAVCEAIAPRSKFHGILQFPQPIQLVLRDALAILGRICDVLLGVL